MALYICDDAVRQLAAELAERQGQSVTETVRAALLEAKARLEDDRARRDAKARAAIGELRAMRRRRVREDVLYDEEGQRAFEVRDISALVAIVNDEPEAERFHNLLLDHEPVISCGTLIETLRIMQVGLGAPALDAIARSSRY